MRWKHAELGNISPSIFIPIAEKSDLIIKISDWVIEKSLSTLQYLQENNLFAKKISVNISAREFMQDNFVERIQNHLLKYQNLPNNSLELELTERVAMHEPDKVRKIFLRLQQIGVKLSLDDFGTGYSSLNTLKNLPLQTLKLDMSFVREVHKSKEDAGVCIAIIKMAQALGLQTIVEGVETYDQLEFFYPSGCGQYLGILFCQTHAN